MSSRTAKREARLRGSAARSLEAGEFKISADPTSSSRELKNLQSALVKNEDINELPRRVSFYRLPKTDASHLNKAVRSPEVDAATPTRAGLSRTDISRRSILTGKQQTSSPLTIKKTPKRIEKSTPAKSPSRKNVVSKSTIRRTLDSLRVEKPAIKEEPVATSLKPRKINSTSDEHDDMNTWIVKNGNRLKQLLRNKEPFNPSQLSNASRSKQNTQANDSIKSKSNLKLNQQQKTTSKRSYTRRTPVARPTTSKSTSKVTKTLKASDEDSVVPDTTVRTRVLRSRTIPVEPVPLSKTRHKERQKPMTIEVDRLLHKDNRDKRLKINRIDALKHLINNFDSEKGDSKSKDHEVVDYEYRLNVISYLDNLLSLSSNVQDMLKRIKQIQREKNEWRQRIFELRQEHSLIGDELSKLRSAHANTKESHNSTTKMVQLTASISQNNGNPQTSTTVYLDDIVRELNARKNQLSLLQLVNQRLEEKVIN